MFVGLEHATGRRRKSPGVCGSCGLLQRLIHKIVRFPFIATAAVSMSSSSNRQRRWRNRLRWASCGGQRRVRAWAASSLKPMVTATRPRALPASAGSACSSRSCRPPSQPPCRRSGALVQGHGQPPDPGPAPGLSRTRRCLRRAVGGALEDLPQGARVGTGSPRVAQLRRRRPIWIFSPFAATSPRARR